MKIAAIGKRSVIGFIVLFGALFFIGADLPETKEIIDESATIPTEVFLSEQERIDVGELLLSEEAIQHYAYLDLDTADEELKPVILEARSRIIYRYAWVADGITGYI